MEIDYIKIYKINADDFIKDLKSIKNISVKKLPFSIKGCFQTKIIQIQIIKPYTNLKEKFDFIKLYEPIKTKHREYFFIE